MPTIELERTLVKSPPELWEELCCEPGLARWLGEVCVRELEAPNRITWDARGATGVIELESSGWGTKVRARVEAARIPTWERLKARQDFEPGLKRLLDDLGSSSLSG
jgi:uncharacterized protein YndB with AHSA1/START domain